MYIMLFFLFLGWCKVGFTVQCILFLYSWSFLWQYSKSFQHWFVSLIWFLTDIFYYLPYWEWEMGFIFLVVLVLVSLLFVGLFETIVVVMSLIDPFPKIDISQEVVSILTQLPSQDLSICTLFPLQGRNKGHS